MKVAGALTLLAGLIAAVVFCLLPTHETELGSTVDCGAPVFGMASSEISTTDAIYEQCQRQSVVHVIIGVAVGLIAGGGGVLMLLLGPSSPAAPAMPVMTERAEYRPRPLGGSVERPVEQRLQATDGEEPKLSPGRWWPVLVAMLILVVAGTAGVVYLRRDNNTDVVSSSQPSATPEHAAPQVTATQDGAASPNGTAPVASAGSGDKRPVGYGAVKLGMSLSELIATGQARDVPLDSDVGCTDFPIDAGGTATYSSTQGQVVYITFAGQMTTSAGIQLGSSAGEVLAAYPKSSFDRFNEAHVAIEPNVSYLIGTTSGLVSELILMSDSQDCAG